MSNSGWLWANPCFSSRIRFLMTRLGPVLSGAKILRRALCPVGDGSPPEIDSVCEEWIVVNAAQYIKLTLFSGGRRKYRSRGPPKRL